MNLKTSDDPPRDPLGRFDFFIDSSASLLYIGFKNMIVISIEFYIKIIRTTRRVIISSF